MSAAGTVLVTGASGFIGSALVNDLARRGYRVRAASRRPLEFASAGIAYVASPELRADFDARPLVAGVAAVVHVAGLAHADPKTPETLYHAVNAESTRRLALAARDAGVARFVLMSSVRAQCGPSSAAPLTEAKSASPTDSYGRSKLSAESAVAEAFAGSAARYAVLRPAIVYGPGVKGNMGALMRLARLPAPLPFAGLTGRRSILSLANLAAAVALVLSPDGPASGIYLAADDEPPTVAGMIAALRAGLGRPPRLFSVPDAVLEAALSLTGRADAADRLFGDLVVDTAKLKAAGWRPVEDSAAALASAMRPTIDR